MNISVDATSAVAEATRSLEMKLAKEKAEAERENSLQEEVGNTL